MKTEKIYNEYIQFSDKKRYEFLFKVLAYESGQSFEKEKERLFKEQLIREAKNRGFVLGASFEKLNNYGCGDYECIVSGEPFLSENKKSLWVPVPNGRNGEIMNDKGQWAKITNNTEKISFNKMSAKKEMPVDIELQNGRTLTVELKVGESISINENVVTIKTLP